MRMMLIVLVSLVTACGAPSGGGTDSPDAGQQQTPTAQPEQKPLPEALPPAPTAVAQEPQYHSMLVATAAALPGCTPAAEGWLVYVQSEAKFKACTAGVWANVDVQGAKGEKGDAGVNGADGTDNRIAASISCGGALASTGINFVYDVSIMTSGDVFVYGATKNSTQQIGASEFYSSKQVGAATAAVTFTDDYEAVSVSSWWKMTLDRQTLVTTIDYNNVALPGGKDTWVMTPDKCIVNSYD